MEERWKLCCIGIILSKTNGNENGTKILLGQKVGKIIKIRRSEYIFKMWRWKEEFVI